MRQQFKGAAARRELMPGESTELLKELHILTKTGDLNADSNRKLKQVNHLVGLLMPAVEDVLARFGTATLVDCGAGKSYLAFILYEVFLKSKEKGEILSIESRPELTTAATERARRLGFDRLSFQTAAIDAAVVPERVHLVTALHACDTATDDAIRRGVELGAKLILVAPCCHKELRPQLGKPEPLAAVLRHGVMEERMAEWVTDGLRALFLEWAGYRTKVFEFVASEHTPKNLMIAAVCHTAAFTDTATRERIEELKGFFGVQQHALDSLLEKSADDSGATAR